MREREVRMGRVILGIPVLADVNASARTDGRIRLVFLLLFVIDSFFDQEDDYEREWENQAPQTSLWSFSTQL
jgi:hypothetical protein